MSRITRFIIAAVLNLMVCYMIIGSALAAEKSEKSKPVAFIQANRGWLDNGTIKVAVDKTYGGSIVYASPSASDTNMVNIHDKGRQIQQSYYAGKRLNRQAEGQSPRWSPWPWNPVQAGNFKGDQSIVLKFEVIENGRVLHTKCQPRLWDMNEELAKCYFSQWMQYEEGMDNVVRVTNTVECFRDKNDLWGPPVNASQELPAVYAIRNLSRLVIYDGDNPWTDDTPTKVQYGPNDHWIWVKRRPTEPWAACVDPKTNIGFGVYSPAGAGNTWNMGWVPKGKRQDKARGTEYSGPTMHFAPLANWKLGYDTHRTFRYWIIIGHLKDIRARVYELHRRYPNKAFTEVRGLKRIMIVSVQNRGWRY